MTMTIISWLNGSALSLEKLIIQAAAMVEKSGGPAERFSYLFIQWDAYMDAIWKECFGEKNVSSQRHFLYTGGK